MGAYTNGEQEDVGRFGALDKSDPDLATIETFVEACFDDGVCQFDWQHLALLAWNLGRDRGKIRRELESFGLKFQERPQVRRIRTVGDNPNDRWYGLGSSPTHGGSGWEQIDGFAGRAG